MGYEAELPYEGQPLHFYFGPNDLAELEATGLDEVGRIIDYGWWIFGWVNRNIILPILSSSRSTSAPDSSSSSDPGHQSALFPITWKNFMSSAKMRVLRPELNEINERHAEDAMKRQQETMELYHGRGQPHDRMPARAVADAAALRHVPVLPGQHRTPWQKLPLGG